MGAKYLTILEKFAYTIRPTNAVMQLQLTGEMHEQARHHPRAPAVIDQLRAVFRQPEIVAGTWKAARAHAGDITEADARAALQQLDPLWDDLFPGEQARIVALLVERVDIGTDGLNVRLRVDGLGSLAREMLAGDMGAAA